MHAKSGVTFLELLVVIAIISVTSLLFVSSGREAVPLHKLTANSRQMAQQLMQLSLDARLSGRTIELICASNTLTAKIYPVNKTYDYSSAKAGVASSQVISQAVIKSSGDGISLQKTCLVTQTYYITSEGGVFSMANTPGIEMTLSAGQFLAQISLSGAGYPRIFIGDTKVIENEI
jgi:prepilin-type N-terminal cleavage/methylation domain-containing protein